MKRVAVYGGSFDPPHTGHLAVIQNIQRSAITDEIWLIPAGAARYDKKPIASAEHRKAMLEIFLDENFKPGEVMINTCQLDNPEDPGYTVDLLDQLKDQYPSHEFLFVVGSDNLSSMKFWKDSRRLIDENKFIVMPRPGHGYPELQHPNFMFIDKALCRQVDVSSSAVREKLASGESTDKYLSAGLRQYISAHRLYPA